MRYPCTSDRWNHPLLTVLKWPFFLFLTQHFALKVIFYRSTSFFVIVTQNYFIRFHSLFGQPPTEEPLGYFLLFPIITTVTTNFLIHTSFCTSTRVSLRSKNAWSLNTCSFSLNTYYLIASKMLCRFTAHQQYVRLSASSESH